MRSQGPRMKKRNIPKIPRLETIQKRGFVFWGWFFFQHALGVNCGWPLAAALYMGLGNAVQNIINSTGNRWK